MGSEMCIRDSAWGVPAIAVHHMEAHLLAPLLEEEPPPFPFVALLVSGGHSMLVDVVDFGAYEVLGQTVDDAAGEAFDKTAKLLGLPYPGGPELARLAEDGDAARFDLPRCTGMRSLKRSRGFRPRQRGHLTASRARR